MDNPVLKPSEPLSATSDSLCSRSTPASLPRLTEEDVWTRGISPENEGCLKGISEFDVSAPCGDQLTMYVRIDSGIIAAMTHISTSCCLTKAIADLLCSACVGHPASYLIELKAADVVQLPISMGRRDCVDLPFRVLRKLYAKAQSEGSPRA